MLETISLKMDKTILQEIDRKLPFYRYSTRTEFIRDAIRSKLSELEKDELLKEVNHLYGASKKKTTDRQLHAAGEKAFRELEKQVK
jgi:metal-responsive CopG/Arc/MetJ family transcriptional regulator